MPVNQKQQASIWMQHSMLAQQSAFEANARAEVASSARAAADLIIVDFM